MNRLSLLSVLVAFSGLSLYADSLNFKEGECKVTVNSNLVHSYIASDALVIPPEIIWDGGYYTTDPKVSVSFQTENPEIDKIVVSVAKGMRSPLRFYGTEILPDREYDIREVKPGEEATFESTVPGVYSLVFRAQDKDENILLSEHILLDCLYDDGQWVDKGTVRIKSGILDPENEYLLPTEGKCELSHYPYYPENGWDATLEYHEGLKSYRIVNPFTGNESLKDYYPTESSHVLVFDRTHPSWLLINAENARDAYCEPTRTGILAFHNSAPLRYTAHRYKEIEGLVWFDKRPYQNIIDDKKYIDSVDGPENSVIIVDFQQTNSVEQIEQKMEEATEIYNLNGIQMDKPEKGQIVIVRKGGKAEKMIVR